MRTPQPSWSVCPALKNLWLHLTTFTINTDCTSTCKVGNFPFKDMQTFFEIWKHILHAVYVLTTSACCSFGLDRVTVDGGKFRKCVQLKCNFAGIITLSLPPLLLTCINLSYRMGHHDSLVSLHFFLRKGYIWLKLSVFQHNYCLWCFSNFSHFMGIHVSRTLCRSDNELHCPLEKHIPLSRTWSLVLTVSRPPDVRTLTIRDVSLFLCIVLSKLHYQRAI